MDGEVDIAPAAEEVADRPAEPAAGVSTLTMLDALRSNPDDPGKALIGALASQGAGGPHADMLLKLLSEQGGGEEAMREEIREELRAEQAEAIAALEETARRLFAEREAGRMQLETLAAALGACPVCFGEDLLCETCHGAGVPGGRAPDPHEFKRLVAPALNRVRAAMRRAAVRRPWPHPPGVAGPPTPITKAPIVNGGQQS